MRTLHSPRSGAFALFAALVLCVTVVGSASAGPTTRHVTTHISDDGDDDGFGFMLCRDDEQSMCGSWTEFDFGAMKRLRDRHPGDMMWARLDDKEVMIRDRAMLARAFTIFEPIQAIGKEQGRTGRRQGELGREQGALGRQQGRIGRLQGQVGRRQGELQRRIAERNRDGESTADLERELDALEVEMDRLHAMQSRLARQQQELSARQEPLSAEQSRLGQRHEQIMKGAKADMRRLVRDAIRNGTAEPVSLHE